MDVTIFSPIEALASRKPCRLGEAEDCGANPAGADLLDFGVKLLLLLCNFRFSTSVFRAGRLEPTCWPLALLKMDEVRNLGLELGAGVLAGF